MKNKNMALTDIEIINKFKLKPKDRILDVGGSMKQHTDIKIDTLVDILHPSESHMGSQKLYAKKFVRLDLNTDIFPFEDNEFDFCICTHTIEDLLYPFLALKEMSRVAKRGYLVTPSFGNDIIFSHVDITNWLTGIRRVPGISHHKWLFYQKQEIVQIIPKNYPLLYSSEFQYSNWIGEEEFEYYWEKEIKWNEINDLDFRIIITKYRDFVKRNKSKLKRTGPVAVYLDNPYFYLKEIAKFFLKKGYGFTNK
ncbi:hypothetical protein A2422_02315 [Candidatus Woesebacteria bacterium RIFOXYC1_FULL_31_51]|nr:MAG: hypothetical protein A2375_01235 [Candidatus Woesebacteria bacterium RIFOXYB1_FULL_31_120]OGM82902.1 MAG: hypothetical protein A2422_02315 [Candidatus Woesebacteria bacterium RIFOXYC1_FULL_31_51]HLD89757.1 methyltransferase domain-containing protein [Patescibacteria group bacterium]